MGVVVVPSQKGIWTGALCVSEEHHDLHAHNANGGTRHSPEAADAPDARDELFASRTVEADEPRDSREGLALLARPLLGIVSQSQPL